MELKDYKVLPGIVIDVSDPKYIGRCKADCPGLFDSSVMNKEGLPWIYPFTMQGYQRFSKLRVGSKIWIFTDKDYKEFWYMPMFQLNDDTKGITSSNDTDYQESEVLLSRTAGAMGVYIYYSPSEGIVLKNGDNSSIIMTPNNEIHIKCGDAEVTLKNNHVYTGNGDTESTEAAVNGETLAKLLGALRSQFLVLYAASMKDCFTASLSAGFKACIDVFPENIEDAILAKNTSVN